MTYGIATDALRGANHFRLFYPSLSFYFVIYVSVSNELVYLGWGSLRDYPGQRSNQEIGRADGVDEA